MGFQGRDRLALPSATARGCVSPLCAGKEAIYAQAWTRSRITMSLCKTGPEKWSSEECQTLVQGCQRPSCRILISRLMIVQQSSLKTGTLFSRNNVNPRSYLACFAPISEDAFSRGGGPCPQATRSMVMRAPSSIPSIRRIDGPVIRATDSDKCLPGSLSSCGVQALV